jgi:SAM-dependent methyltransferase
MAILDLGVGGGRTTAYLASCASRYVGADYAPEMIRFCRAKFPQQEFVVTDASDLSLFSDASFDAVVLAFNAIDSVIPDKKRQQCLRECRRVLRPGGRLIFSSHNPRAVLIRPCWNPRRVRAVAENITRTVPAAYRLAYAATFSARVFAAVLTAVWLTGIRLVRRLPSRPFWLGEGYMLDRSHGGLLTHYFVPKRVIAELQRSGFGWLVTLGDDYPRRSGLFVTDWYYYVFERLD